MRIQVQFGRNSHFAQFPINQGGAIGGIRVVLPVMQAHGAGFVVEGEDTAQLYVRPVAVPTASGAGLAVRSDIGRGVHDGDIDVTRHAVQLVYGRIGLGLRSRGQQERQMRTGRHGHRTDLLRVIASLFSLVPHQPYGPLTIIPGRLVNGKTLGTGSAVYQAHALDAQTGEFLFPVLDERHVTGVVIGAAGDEDHTGAVGLLRGRIPFQIGIPVGVRVKARRTGNIRHSGYLLPLGVGHAAGGPDGHTLLGTDRQADQQKEKGGKELVHADICFAQK